ncbi:MAG: DNA internalization-related competence protein ComEC/Rec2 [Polyangiales bacterium]
MNGPLPLVALGFLLGLALPWSPDARVAAPLAIILALGGSLAARRRRGALGAALLLAAALLAGSSRRASLMLPAWTRVPTADAELLAGRVVQGCASDGEHDRCLVEMPAWGIVDVRLPPGRCAATPGDLIEAAMTVRPLVPVRNPPRDPPEHTRALRGVRWTADAAACVVTGRRATPLDALRTAALRVRQRTERSLARALAPEHAARARALLFGDRSGLRPDEHEAFRETGMAHLLAVSGAHVSLLLGLAGAALRALALRWPRLAVEGFAPRLAATLPLPLVGFFILVTGEAPSSLRALLTALVGAVASLAGRRARGEAVVAGVALAMGACDPVLVTDVGWVLSVAASWALARGSADPAPPPEGLVAYLRGELTAALAASARVGFAVAPALAWHFGRAPLSAVVLNAVAAPVGEALLLPAVLGAALAGAVLPTWALGLPGRVVGALLGALFALPSAAARLPLASVALPAPTPAEWVVATAFGVAACGCRAKARLMLALMCVATLGAIELHHRRGLHPRGVLRVTALDVGQGDALVVELPDGTAMLIDAGGAITGGPDPGERVVAPWLALRRRGELAAVVLSHPHPDHGGGLAAVLSTVHTVELWDTGQGAALGTGGFYADALAAARRGGARVRGPASLCGPPRPFHGVMLEVLSPCPSARDDTPPNDASFVIRLSYGRASVLLPGDLERDGEAALLASMRPVSVLKVGHHGSRTSTTDAWLDALRPHVALVSCGHPSPFGHPHPEVVARLRARGIDVRRTDLMGAVAVTLHADGRVE